MTTGIASALLATSLPHHLWTIIRDPLHGDGYQWWSGLGSDLAYVGAFGIFWRHHNCHIKGCPWWGHVHPVEGVPYCRKHRPQPKENS